MHQQYLAESILYEKSKVVTDRIELTEGHVKENTASDELCSVWICRMSAALEVEQNASHEGSKVGKEGYDYILQHRQNKTGSELSKGNDVAAKVWAV